MTKQWMFYVLGAGLLLSTLVVFSLAWAGGPQAAMQAIAEDGQLRIDAKDRCPVCGMFPAKRPQNAAGMTLADGRSFYFCGNGCLLRTYRNATQYLGADAPAITRVVVQDYFSGVPVDGLKAWWVAGSDVIGPMGPALVAFASRQDVETFMQRHGGQEVFQIADIDDALWGRLFAHKKK